MPASGLTSFVKPDVRCGTENMQYGLKTGFHPRRKFASLGGRRGANHVCLVPAIQMKGWLLPTSLGDAGLAAMCCLTLFLSGLVSRLGISGVLVYAYRDDILLPILAVFLILTGYALWQRRQAK